MPPSTPTTILRSSAQTHLVVTHEGRGGVGGLEAEPVRRPTRGLCERGRQNGTP
jgi:hypothetical protein